MPSEIVLEIAVWVGIPSLIIGLLWARAWHSWDDYNSNPIIMPLYVFFFTGLPLYGLVKLIGMFFCWPF